MRVSYLFLVAICWLAVADVRADDCDKAGETDGEVTAWFKPLGCKISKGAGELSDSAKPWTDKIGSAAKDLGSNVAQKFDELIVVIKMVIKHEPTEKVPLAPLDADKPSAAAATAAAAAA